MRLRSLVCIVTVLSGLTSASDLGSREWAVVAGDRGDEVVYMTVAFHQPRLAEAERLLLKVSDPRSPRFGQYLSRDELVSRSTCPPG